MNWIDTLSFQQIRNTLADYIMKENVDKVPITFHQLEKFFKVRGLRIKDGTMTEETRGQFSKRREERKEDDL